jgi:hypothetical protein
MVRKIVPKTSYGGLDWEPKSYASEIAARFALGALDKKKGESACSNEHTANDLSSWLTPPHQNWNKIPHFILGLPNMGPYIETLYCAATEFSGLTVPPIQIAVDAYVLGYDSHRFSKLSHWDTLIDRMATKCVLHPTDRSTRVPAHTKEFLATLRENAPKPRVFFHLYQILAHLYINGFPLLSEVALNGINSCWVTWGRVTHQLDNELTVQVAHLGNSRVGAHANKFRVYENYKPRAVELCPDMPTTTDYLNSTVAVHRGRVIIVLNSNQEEALRETTQRVLNIPQWRTPLS